MNLMAAAVSMNLVRARAIPVYVPGARSSVMHLRRRNRTEFYGCLSVLVVVFAAHLWKIRGACQRKILGVNPTKSAAAANRAEIFDRRVHANRASSARPQDITNRIPSGSSTHSSIGPSTPVDDILALRMAAQSSGAAESKLAIQWTIQLANTDSGSIGKENGAMGKTMRALPESTSTQHVLEYMTWESRIAWKEAKNMWPLHPPVTTVLFGVTKIRPSPKMVLIPCSRCTHGRRPTTHPQSSQTPQPVPRVRRRQATPPCFLSC